MKRTFGGKWNQVAIVALACAFLYPFIRTLDRIGDEGTLVYGAQRVTQGAVPYRDFVEVIGPASFYWLGLFFKLFGISWWVARAHLMLTGVLISLLVYWLTRRLCRGPESLLPFLLITTLGIPLWPGASHHWDSNLFALAAAAAYFKWQESGRTWLLTAAGLAAGITSSFMPQKGLLLICALAALVLLAGDSRRLPAAKRNSVLLLLCGYLAVGAVTVLWFYRLGALHELIYCTVMMPLTTYSSINVVPYGMFAFETAWGVCAGVMNSLPGFAPFFLLLATSLVPVLTVAAVPLLALVLGIVCVAARSVRKRCVNSPALPYYVIGAALCLSEFHRKDFFHIGWGAPLLLIVMVYAAKCLLPGRRVRVWSLGGFAACLFLFAGANWASAFGAQSRIETRRGAIVARQDDAALRFLSARVSREEGVFIYPYYSKRQF